MGSELAQLMDIVKAQLVMLLALNQPAIPMMSQQCKVNAQAIGSALEEGCVLPLDGVRELHDQSISLFSINF
jgi:hypothetical protein